MRITSITVWQLDLPLIEPYRLSGGRLRVDRLDSTILRIETDAGVVGWGEGCPWGHTYLPAHGPGLRASLSLLAPALIGEDPRQIDRIGAIMDITLPGHPYAKAPLDMACWDLLGRAAGLPLVTLLGGADGDHIMPNSSIPTGTPTEMIARIERARLDGYRAHSAKLGGSDPATDIARIEAIEAALAPGERVTYDINRAWTPAVARQVLTTVPARGWVEQPCETLEECALVQHAVPQAVMLDECVHTVGDHLRAWQLGACAGVKVKPNRLGGLTRARQVRDLGIALGWQMHLEDLGGTVLADTAAMHLALSTPQTYRLASWLCHPHLADDPFPGQGARNRDGRITLPGGPGIGVTPDPETLGAPVAAYT